MQPQCIVQSAAGLCSLAALSLCTVPCVAVAAASGVVDEPLWGSRGGPGTARRGYDAARHP